MKINRSRSGSAHSGSRRSGSGSSRSRSRSGSGSKASRSRSRSGSASSKRSGSGSPGSQRSKSGSPTSQRSKSGSPASNRSKSGSPQSKKSGSGSPQTRKSGSRSRSGSPTTNVSPEKRKRKILSDSDDSDAGTKKTSPVKKSKLIDTDDESDEEQQKSSQPAAGDIFGDADDISSDEDAKSDGSAKRKSRSASEASRRSSKSKSRSRSRSRQRSRSGSRSDSNERARSREKTEEREKTPIPETRIDVEIPRIVADLGREIHFVKLPNFLSVDTRPFDPDTYEDEIDEEETLDEEGRQRLKLKVGNTMRWRRFINDKGETITESNARFVRWSDNSLSLYLGSEIFDVSKHLLMNDYNHLFIRQGTGLQGQAVFRTKLSFRPHSTDSLTHKKMTISLADRSQKTSGIKIITQVGHDPEAERAVNLRKEEESLRQVMRARKPIRKRTKRPSGAGYDNPDDGSEEEGAISIAAIKNKYKKGTATGTDKKPIYSSEDEDDASDGSDFDARRGKKREKGKAKAIRDSEDDEEESGGESDRSGSEKSAEESGKDSGSDKSDHSDDNDDDE